MPVNPRVLEMIANPTSGKLGEIGQTLNKNRQYAEKMALEQEKLDADEAQRQEENERKNAQAQRQQEEANRKQVDFGSKVVMALAGDAIEWYETNKDKYEDEKEFQAAWKLFQDEQYATAPDEIKALAKKDFQTIEQYRSGYNMSSDLQRKINPDDFDGVAGTSEFERHINYQLKMGLITQDQANDMIEKRAGVLAGTDMRITDKTRIEESKRKAGVKETTDLRKEWKQGSEHFDSMTSTIDEAITALDSGNTGLADTMLNQVMSQVQDDNVRAFAMYQQFDKPFGNLANRVKESIDRFLGGKRSDEEKEEIRSTLQYFKDAYADPKRGAIRDRYRALAVEQGADPFEVVPPSSLEDVRDSRLIDKKRKKELIKIHYPEAFTK